MPQSPTTFETARKPLRTYEAITDVTRHWYKSLCARADSDTVLCVAIARKAPRLIEWCKREFPDVDGQRLEVITEIALPFIGQSEKKAVVVDEAVYHGTTFSNVFSLAEQTIGVRLTPVPVTVTIEAFLNFRFHHGIPLRNVQLIADEEVPLYVNTVISRFLTLGKPYDIEHPLFYVSLPAGEEWDKERVWQMLGNFTDMEARRHGIDSSEIESYATETYSREKARKYTSYTVMCDYLFRKSPWGLSPCFAKLRFFTAGNRLCVAAMSPFTISEEALAADSPMFSGGYREVWNDIIAAAPEVSQSDGHRRSLVVVANYLHSLSLYARIAPSLHVALKNVGEDSSVVSMDAADLQLLVGKTLAEKLLPRLRSLINEQNKPSARFPTPDDDGSYIPAVYRSDYEAAICRDTLSTERFSVEPMLSGLVSAMHREVEMRSRKSPHQDSDRLCFGETYRSLTARMRPIARLTEKDTLSQLNRGVDRRIDIGTMVPTYLKHGSDLNPYWTRAFRSGENEDTDRDQPLRLLVAVTKNYLSATGYMVFHPVEIELVLSKIATSPRLRMLFGHPLTIVGEPGDYHTCLCLNDHDRPQLVTLAHEVGLLETRAGGLLRISSFSSLGPGAVWEKSEEDEVSKITQEVGRLSKHTSIAKIREMINDMAERQSRQT